MATSRSVAGRAVTSSSPIRMAPEVALSSPAIMRRVVVLPHPEGPSRVTSSPFSMRNETRSTARTSPP